MIVRIRGESKLRPRAVRVPVPSKSGSWTVPGWGPPVRMSVRSFLEWVPGPGRCRKPTLPVQASLNLQWWTKPEPRTKPEPGLTEIEPLIHLHFLNFQLFFIPSR